MYTIPLRRALVVDSDLPYPEGVAAAEVLKVGSGAGPTAPRARARGKAGLWRRHRAVASAVRPAGRRPGVRRRGGAASSSFRRRWAAPPASASACQLALLGAGHLMGMTVGWPCCSA
jgi:uncharacterized oligopeptide transporter (OPT) family protein